MDHVIKLLHKIGRTGYLNIFLVSFITILLAACQAGIPAAPSVESGVGTDIDVELRVLIEENGLTGDPSQGRQLVDIEDPLAQLGMKLFYSKALGGDLDTACVSCHHPLLGGGDGLALSIGVGAEVPDLLGPGRTRPDGIPNVGRNAPTTFNIALWDQVLFHDGRIESLGKTPGVNGDDGQGICTPDMKYGEADPQAGRNLTIAQSRFPITSVAEMRGHEFERHRHNLYVRSHLAARIGDYDAGKGELDRNQWLGEFKAALNATSDADFLITEEKIATAIGAYENSQVFVDTPWQAYVQGERDAISPAAKRGALLFFRESSEGGAQCNSCHSGDFFTDEQFYVLAIPQVGPGKEDGPYNDDDFGRFRTTGNPDDLYAFRTPSLLNVEVTSPYGHDGAYASLEEIVRHHLHPTEAVASYTISQLDPGISTEHMIENTGRALAKLEQDQQKKRTPLEVLSLSDREVGDLVEFLLALTDPCTKDPECLSPWIPEDNDLDPDGLRLEAQFDVVSR